MSKISTKPSYEVNMQNNTNSNISSTWCDEDISIPGITFAIADDLSNSIKYSCQNINVWTLAERLNSIEKVSPVPLLEGSN